MIEHWPWYLSGVALASIPFIHWLAFNRSLAVSGRVSSLVNRARHGKDEPVEMSADELLEAVRAATIAQFGASAIETAPAPGGEAPALATRASASSHFLFLGGMIAGGLISALLAGSFKPAFTLRAETFGQIFGNSPITMGAVLLGGGLLVGFGTRMAAGCTTGHGLCGVSRLQKGSLVATAAFFGAAVAASLLMRVVS